MSEENKVYRAYEIEDNKGEKQIKAFSGITIGKPKLDAKTGIEWCKVNFNEGIINGIFFKSETQRVPCDSLFETPNEAIDDYLSRENIALGHAPEILLRMKKGNTGGKVRYKLKKQKSLQKGKQQKSKRVKKKKTKKLLRKQTRTRKK